jgi:hypothetical protein
MWVVAPALQKIPRHCERSEAIHLFRAPGTKDGLLRCARNDEFVLAQALPRPAYAKVFWFFFSKKNRFLAFP